MKIALKIQKEDYHGNSPVQKRTGFKSDYFEKFTFVFALFFIYSILPHNKIRVRKPHPSLNIIHANSVFGLGTIHSGFQKKKNINPT